MSAPRSAAASRLLDRPLARRLLGGPQSVGPGVVDALRIAEEVVAGGRPVAVEHVPAAAADAAAELTELISRVHAAGLGAAIELTVPVDRLGAAAAVRLGRRAHEGGLTVALAGPPDVVWPVSTDLPGVTVVVAAGEADSERRCRVLAEQRVRLVRSRGHDADLRFVRCLNVLMAAGGTPEVATADRRLIAITGERAAWNGRSAESWEYVMPYGVRTEHQQRLTAAGFIVRVAVASGAVLVRGRRS